MSVTTRRIRHFALVATGALTLAAALMAVPASADPPPWEEVATGLDNPRQLTFREGSLYVAEAGVGGSGPCVAAGGEGEACYGRSGAVTRIRHGNQSRVLSQLPSLAPEGGGAALGPADVIINGDRHFAVTMGLGGDPAIRSDLPRLGRRLMGTIITGKFGDRIWRGADLAAHEAAGDPDGLGPDSNPTGLTGRWGEYVATDSGGNTLLSVNTREHTVGTLAVFDSPGTFPSPFPPFEDVEAQPVPTSVAVGPDHAYYVSELTGFPFAPDAARIHRVVPGEAPTVYATGLTNVTDLAWHEGELYVVQIADSGLLSAPEDELPMGSVLRVDTGGAHETVAGPFPAPYGLAIRHDAAYVTTCSVCPDGGSVVKVPLD